MPRTRVRQDEQIHASEVYDDTVAPTEANYETNPTSLQEDMNNLRSLARYLKNRQVSGNWFDVLATPSTFTGEGEGPRAVDDLNQDLWDLQRKRVLVAADSVADVAVPAAQNWVVLGAGELPPNTTAAVGAVTTRGTVVATHGGTFGSHDLAEVVGSTNISPKNLIEVVDGATRDPILDSSDRRIWGLLQGESGLVDGDTILTTTPDRVQVSFVVLNVTADDLIACTVADIQGKTVNFAFAERKALEDLTEQDFLRGAVADVPSGATTTRQQGYNNQGTTPVDLTTNATLDLEGAGLIWAIRDDAEAVLFRVIEGSGGGTSEVELGADVDIFDVNAIDVDFDQGISVNTGGTRPIDVGTTDGVVESTAGDLEVQAAAELILSDGNESVGWSRNGILLSDTSTEWDDFESEFGEVSLLAAIVAAKQNTERVSGWANVNQNINANTLIDGSGGTPNITAQLPSYKGLTFVDQVEVFINGVKQRPGADAAANNDVYPSAVAVEQGVGAFYCEYNLLFRAGANPDNINMVVYGQPDP
jgi:hypothetical protein